MQERSNRPNEQRVNRRHHDIEPHLGRKLAEVERDMILGTLTRCGGNRTWAADILGISIRTLRNRLINYHDAPMGQSGRPTLAERMEDERLALLDAFDPGARIPS